MNIHRTHHGDNGDGDLIQGALHYSILFFIFPSAIFLSHWSFSIRRVRQENG